MKKNRWLRFFFSYLFVFLFMAVSLVAIFLVVIGNKAKEEAMNANQAYARSVIKTFDESLRNLEQAMIREALTNTGIQSFFNADGGDDTYANYVLYSRLRELSSTMNGIDSIYLYRIADNKVMSESYFLPLAEFEDQAFVRERIANPSAPAWSSPRMYASVKGGTGQRVVSLVKGIPFGTTQQGLLVVNLSLPSLQSTFSDIARSELHYAYLTDAAQNDIFHRGDVPQADIVALQSETTGWVLHSGLHDKRIGGFLSLLSYSWLLFAVFVILFGIILLFYVFRRNYKPLHTISNRIQQYANKGGYAPEGDPFAFIETSIETLIVQSQHHEAQALQDLALKKSMWFRGLMSGSNDTVPAEWQTVAAPDSLGTVRSFLVLLIEIDDYEAFASAYSQRDQSLLKFTLRAAIQEMTDNRAGTIWMDWMSGSRLCNLIALDGELAYSDKAAGELGEEWRQWIEQYLKFTVTVGIGEFASSLSAVSHSYAVALDMLEVKASAGPNRVISPEMTASKPPAVVYEQLEHIRSMIQSFKTDKELWKKELAAIFAEMRAGLSSRKTIVSLIDYLQYHLTLEMSDMSEEIAGQWSGKLPRLQAAARQFTALDELEREWFQALSDISLTISVRRESNPHYHNLEAIKSYIERHYADPGLSLNQISGHFQLSPSHFSLIFKEVLNEKFMDYLIRIRIEQAKRLLEETDAAVQDVALQVGYVHSISFIRVFKKWTGMTPGDFRKRK
ncbi:AraC family transcriptional regulator [Paenibacillus hodogayensis]|uniref:AraC family transcriptional regulator n=1 Tax=Paenibacillus hodogayensis TaxID=279208 RepID=A0ABV5VPP2_9BACL